MVKKIITNKFFDITVAIIVIFCGPVVMEFFVKNVVNENWLGFWGGYFGAVVGVFGIFWQVDKTIKSEKENQFRMSRPFFIIRGIESNMNLVENKNKYYTALKYDGDPEGIKLAKYVVSHEKYNMGSIEINNISNKIMMAVIINLEFEGDNSNQKSNIERIKPGTLIHIIDKNDVLNSGKGDAYRSKMPKGLTIQFTTELREKIQLHFSCSDGIFKYDSKILENKCSKKEKKKINNDYDINSFYVTQRFIANHEMIRITKSLTEKVS